MSSAPESLSPSLNIITELHSQLSVCSDCYARARSVESLVSSSWETFSPPALITSIRSSAHQTGLHPPLSTPISTSQPGHCLHFLLSQVRIRYESCETMQRRIIDMFSDHRHLVAGCDSVLPDGGAGPLPRGEHPRPLQQDPHPALHLPGRQGT